MEGKLSKYLTGFRKSHGTQYLLVTMFEKWKKAVDKGDYVSASEGLRKLMLSYLNSRKKQIQINTKFSSESTAIAGVPQGLLDGPLLFNLFMNDCVYFIQYYTYNK